jgi:hypothetical protein
METAVESLETELKADRYHLAGVGFEYLHRESTELVKIVAETGCAVHVLGIRGHRPVSSGVVLVRIEDAAQWVQDVVANSGSEAYPAAYSVKEAAELAAVTPAAIRQQMHRSRRENGNGHDPDH